uniref:FzdB n=1 Tax=Halisarca dujardinii TaxID=2583056 RepID=A0AAU8KZY3_HALDU
MGVLALFLTLFALLSACVAQQDVCVKVPADVIECRVLYNDTLFRTLGARPIAHSNWNHYRDNLFLECSGGPYNAMAFACLALYRECENNTFVSGRRPCRNFCTQITTVDCSNVFTGIGVAFVSILQPFECTQYPQTDCISAGTPEMESLAAAIEVRIDDRPSGSGSLPSQTPSTALPLDNCTLSKLQEGYFTVGERIFAKAWIAVWSAACVVSTLLTVITFCLDRSRFQYPWRPIIYLSACFITLSLSYFLVLALGPDLIVRVEGKYVASRALWEWSHAPCILTFTLLYYSQLASAMWWVVLTLCWFLAAGLKWGNEAIAQLAPFYHVLAWSIPLILTISLMAGKVIAADDLVGACFVVRDHNPESFYGLLFGYLLPLIIILLVGSGFMGVGFLAIIRVRRHFRKGGEETGSLDKLIIRMGVFNIIYLIPAVVVIGCTVYELVGQAYWCPASSLENDCAPCHRAAAGVFIARILFSLAVGILSGMWIWSRKTLTSWRTAFAKCCSTAPRGASNLATEAAGPTTTSITEEDRATIEGGAVSTANLADQKSRASIEMHPVNGNQHHQHHHQHSTNNSSSNNTTTNNSSSSSNTNSSSSGSSSRLPLCECPGSVA